MSIEITPEEAALYWAQGKRVEASPRGTEDWRRMAAIGEAADGDRVFNARVFYRDYKFRLATEPPAKKFRHWLMEEVPLLALVRRKGFDERAIILGASSASTVWITNNQITNKVLAEEWEHSIDSGKTWHPCGVEVTS